MYIRQDTMRQAEAFSVVTKMSADAIYRWLLAVGNDKGINPRKLAFTTAEVIIFVTGERDDYCLSSFRNTPVKYSRHQFCGPDYEDLILARQEALLT